MRSPVLPEKCINLPKRLIKQREIRFSLQDSKRLRLFDFFPNNIYTANHNKDDSCSMRYLSWKKWLINIFCEKWKECHQMKPMSQFPRVFINYQRFYEKNGFWICVCTLNSLKIKKGTFSFDFCHLQCKKSIEIIDHLKDIQKSFHLLPISRFYYYLGHKDPDSFKVS